jgi:hypothetical protein
MSGHFRRQRSLFGVVLVGATVVTAACSGRIGEPLGLFGQAPATGGGAGGSGPGTGDSGSAGSPPEVIPPFAPAAPAFARLTGAQYANVIRDLFGPQIQIPELEADTRPYLFSVIGASTTTISEHGVDLYTQAAHAIANAAFSDTAGRVKLVPCTVAAPLDNVCLGRFINELGLRAWRRPLEASELDRYQALGAQIGLGDPWKALEYVTAAMLQSPHFLYRVELGWPDADHPGWMHYTDYEMASRISFLMRNSFPDAELFAAAARGDLTTKSGILAQVNRLMNDVSPTEQMIQKLYQEYLDLPLLADVAFPASMDPNGTMAKSMESEVEEVVSRIALRQPADMRTLFTTRSVAVNSDLAALYGLTPTSSTSLQPAELPADGPRAGILTMGALLTLNNRPNRTSPTIRGHAVRERLLCGSVPPPPPGIPPIRDDNDAGPPKTIREKLAAHRTNPSCNACHRLMDPIGLGMEDFDQYGRHRTTYDTGQVVDDTGDLDDVVFHGAKELGDLLSKDARTTSCLVKQIYRYSSSRLETDGESIVLDGLDQAFANSGYLLKPLLLELVTSDGFRYLKPEAP